MSDFEKRFDDYKSQIAFELVQGKESSQVPGCLEKIDLNRELAKHFFDIQQAIINDLKAQLNNMETCYIEKKKQVEVCVALVIGWREKPMGGWSDYARGGLHSREDCADDLEKALRGEP